MPLLQIFPVLTLLGAMINGAQAHPKGYSVPAEPTAQIGKRGFDGPIPTPAPTAVADIPINLLKRQWGSVLADQGTRLVNATAKGQTASYALVTSTIANFGNISAATALPDANPPMIIYPRAKDIGFDLMGIAVLWNHLSTYML